MLKSFYHSLKPLLLKLVNGKKLNASYTQRRWERGLTVHIADGTVKIGKNCNFRSNLQLRVLNGGSIEIGDNGFVNTNVSITSQEKIRIGDNVKIANNVVIVDHDHDYRNGNRGYKTGEIIIGNNVWIGANCVILRNTVIGDNCVVGAGSVVNANIPAYSIVAGTPAKIIKKLMEERGCE